MPVIDEIFQQFSDTPYTATCTCQREITNIFANFSIVKLIFASKVQLVFRLCDSNVFQGRRALECGI